MRIASVLSPRRTRNASNGPRIAPALFCTVCRRSPRTSLAATTTPPMPSERPLRYLVVECTTRSAPSSSGRCSTGVRKVLSTTRSAPASWATSATAVMSTSCISGLVDVHRARLGLGQLPRPPLRTGHSVVGRGGDDLGAQGGHQPLLLARKPLGHEQHDPVSPPAADQGEGEAGVARRRLDDGPARGQAGGPGAVDEGEADPVTSDGRLATEADSGIGRRAAGRGMRVAGSTRGGSSALIAAAVRCPCPCPFLCPCPCRCRCRCG